MKGTKSIPCPLMYTKIDIVAQPSAFSALTFKEVNLSPDLNVIIGQYRECERRDKCLQQEAKIWLTA